jgi:hypothetical protein
MARRRLIKFVGVLELVTAGAAWWLSIDRLSAEEQRLLGTWYLREPPGMRLAGGVVVHDYGPDRTCRVHLIDRRTGTVAVRRDGRPDETLGRWQVRDGKLVCAWDTGLLGRVRQALPARVSGTKRGTSEILEIERLTDDELVVRDRMGRVGRLTRDPAD